jgi:hypothetical protein
VRQYVNNAIRADQQLKGTTIIVRGTITEVGKDNAGNYYVGLNGVLEDSLVKCVFSDEHASHLAELEKGRETVLRGRVYGWVQLNVGDVGVAGRVDLAECSIVPPQEPTQSSQALEAGRSSSNEALTKQQTTPDVQIYIDPAVERIMTSAGFTEQMIKEAVSKALVTNKVVCIDTNRVLEQDDWVSVRLSNGNSNPQLGTPLILEMSVLNGASVNNQLIRWEAQKIVTFPSQSRGSEVVQAIDSLMQSLATDFNSVAYMTGHMREQ